MSIHDIVLGDVSPWTLENTATTGLSLRQMSSDGILISTPDICHDEDLMRWHVDLPVGIHRYHKVGKGLSPVKAALQDSYTMAMIVEALHEGGTIKLFSAMQGQAEEQLIKELMRQTGLDLETILMMVSANNPATTPLMDKIPQRELALENGMGDLFLPYMLSSLDEAELSRKIQQIIATGISPDVLVRVDGQASGDGSCRFSNMSPHEIREELSRFKKNVVLIEPCVPHDALSTLLNITAEQVHVLTVTHQIDSRDRLTNAPHWAGNVIMRGAVKDSLITPTTVSRALELGEQMGRLLQRKGVRGPVSVDQLARPGASQTITEANLRRGNGSAALDLMHSMNSHLGYEVVAGMIKFSPTIDGVDKFFGQKKLLGSLLWQPGRSYGIIPYSLLPGQCFCGVVAKDLSEFQDLIADSWGLYGCQDTAPVLIKEKVHDSSAN